MELWTEYEGRTIDGSFPLKKLLRPEGRSAFFSTSNSKGIPTVIRLIESHFDDEEILARWRGVEALHHPNILKLEKYGQVMIDETSVVYAVMEPVDGNLGEVVSHQHLTISDTRQLAISLIAALETLHKHGFVHEHVEPANVLAVGEVVKLRSDCIRELPEGEDGKKLKKQDLHDFAVVLLQALTQKKTLEAATRELPLPAPFDQLVRMGMSGEWGVAEISAALKTSNGKPSKALPEVRTASLPTTAAAEPKKDEAAPPAEPLHRPVESSRARSADPKPVSPPIPWPRFGLPQIGWIIGIVLVMVLFVWLGWGLLHNRPADQNNARPAPPTPAPAVNKTVPKPAAAIAPVVKTNAPTVPNAAPKNEVAGDPRQWRVIAYTYNREDQAQKKSRTVAQRHPDLNPEVFTPTGRAPYLVTIGGTMNRDDAFALVKKVHREGLPRDTYAQNYSGKALAATHHDEPRELPRD
jgi:eukaryotic-like serine/threonine-protein kinase